MIPDTFDCLFGNQVFKPFECPTFGENSEVFIERNQGIEKFEMKSETTKQEICQNTYCPDIEEVEEMRSSQSSLHNCPKHLIKQIVQCLGFPTNEILQLDQFVELNEEIKTSLKYLLGMLELCSKGKIKSLSKELLKLIYEQGSQNNPKVKLMQQAPIKRLIKSCNPKTISQAKSILRQFTIRRLQQTRSNSIDHSHSTRKIINQRYLQIFISQLRSGKVSERVSKQDKDWILSL